MRCFIDPVGGGDLHQLALVHHRHAGGDGHRFLLIVGDDDEGGAGFLLNIHQFELRFLAQLAVERAERFVEEELLQYFSKMIAFVQQTEAHLAQVVREASAGGDEKMDVNPSVVEGLVREFSSTWKSNIDLINRNVLSYFSNFRNGMEILKQVLTQLLLYYTRFQDIIRKIWRGKPPPFSKDLVSTTLILAEIKKYALAI